MPLTNQLCNDNMARVLPQDSCFENFFSISFRLRSKWGLQQLSAPSGKQQYLQWNERRPTEARAPTAAAQQSPAAACQRRGWGWRRDRPHFQQGRHQPTRLPQLPINHRIHTPTIVILGHICKVMIIVFILYNGHCFWNIKVPNIKGCKVIRARYLSYILFVRTLYKCMSHLSKGQSYLKEKCTQHPTPFSGTVLNAFSLGLIHFVQSVSLRNHFLVGWNSSTANQKLPF